MQLEKISGYMLGNAGHMPGCGQCWSSYDMPVYFCTDINKAKEILEKSQSQCELEPHVVWTTVYKVCGNNINIFKIEDGLLWTMQPSRIMVEKPVFYKKPRQLTEQELRQKARMIMPEYVKLMKSLKGKVK